MDKEEFISDTEIRMELIGMPTHLVRFPEHTSSQRMLMSASAMAQAEVVDGAEPPKIQTGFESKYGRYQFSTSERDQDIIVYDIIPKFVSTINSNGLSIRNPATTVVYIGADDGLVGCFDIEDYTMVSSGFGYKNKITNKHMLSKGDYIPKDIKFTSAPNHDGELYNMGVMANTCYIPLWETTDDAFIISESFARKLDRQAFDSLTVNLKEGEIPLNLYGTATEHKAFPDVGERVRDDGIVFGIRQHNDNTFLSDFSVDALRQPDHLYDELFLIPQGAEIIDIQVYSSHRYFKKQLEATGDANCAMAQFMYYQSLHNRYYDRVLATYRELEEKGYKCGRTFSTLVERCMAFSYRNNSNKQSMELYDKKEPIVAMQIVITYAYPMRVSLGAKVTGVEGSKGVVSAIWKDEDMPVSEHGLRADIIITPESPFNRLNVGQLYEQFITLVSEVVRNNVITGIVPRDQAYEYILGYLHEVRPVYAKLVREKTYNNQDAFVEAVINDGIYLVIPPFCKTITPELIMRLSEKYNVYRGPITYYRRDAQGNRTKIVTKYPGLIGSRYMYLLGKRPINQLAVTELGYINQFKNPIKLKMARTKSQYLTKRTPQRYGEDEVAIISCCAGPESAARILGVYSNSPVAAEELSHRLLTDPNPSALKSISLSNEDVGRTSSNIGLLDHMLAEVGYTPVIMEV